MKVYFFVSSRAICFFDTMLLQFVVVGFFMVILIMQYHCHDRKDIAFDSFFEQIQIRLKRKNSDN